MQQNVSPPRKDLVKVKTIYNSTIMPCNRPVYVRLDDGRYMLTPVSTVKPGQWLLFRKDEITGLSLEEVDEALRLKSARYLDSTKNLFVTFDSESRPIFQQVLLSGIMEKPEMWPQQIASDSSIKALFGSNQPIQLNYSQCASAAEFIRQKLEEKGVSQPVTTGHIEYNWLEGNVLSPRNRKAVVGALSEISPALAVLLSDSFGKAYREFIVIRQKVMMAILNDLRSQRMEKASVAANSSEQAGNGEYKISVAQEVNAILDIYTSRVTN